MGVGQIAIDTYLLLYILPMVKKSSSAKSFKFEIVRERDKKDDFAIKLYIFCRVGLAVNDIKKQTKNECVRIYHWNVEQKMRIATKLKSIIYSKKKREKNWMRCILLFHNKRTSYSFIYLFSSVFFSLISLQISFHWSLFTINSSNKWMNEHN